MSPRRIVACGAFLVAVAHAFLSPLQQEAVNALAEVATDALIALRQVKTATRSGDTQADSTSLSAVGKDLAVDASTGAGLPETPAAQPTAQPGPRALQENSELEEAMWVVRRKISENGSLMRRLARCEADEAGKLDAVVCVLARAVRSVVRQSQSVGGALPERPAALAALLWWDALGTVQETPGGLVLIADLRGLALLLGRPDPRALDGAGAFAFRSLQAVAAEVGSAGAEKEGAVDGDRWLSLQRAAASGMNTLASPVLSCLQLVSGQHTHAAVLAAASVTELTVCNFAVKVHAALRVLQMLGPEENVSDERFQKHLVDVQGYVEENSAVLLVACPTKIGPVFGAPVCDADVPCAIESPAGAVRTWQTVAAVAQFLRKMERTRLFIDFNRSRKEEEGLAMDDDSRVVGGRRHSDAELDLEVQTVLARAPTEQWRPLAASPQQQPEKHQQEGLMAVSNKKEARNTLSNILSSLKLEKAAGQLAPQQPLRRPKALLAPRTTLAASANSFYFYKLKRTRSSPPAVQEDSAEAKRVRRTSVVQQHSESKVPAGINASVTQLLEKVKSRLGEHLLLQHGKEELQLRRLVPSRQEKSNLARPWE